MVRRCGWRSGAAATACIGGMRRQHRHRPAPVRHRLRLGARRPRRPAMTPAAATRSSTRSRAWRAAVGRAVGPARFRRLRQRDQQRRLAERQPPRLLAEIGERGGAHAFEIAAVGREAEIEREDFVLAERAFELRSRAPSGAAWRQACARARGSSRRATCMVRVEAAGDDAAVARRTAGSARQRQRIDAVMRVEALVLVGDEQLEKARIDIFAAAGSRQRPSGVV